MHTFGPFKTANNEREKSFHVNLCLYGEFRDGEKDGSPGFVGNVLAENFLSMLELSLIFTIGSF